MSSPSAPPSERFEWPAGRRPAVARSWWATGCLVFALPGAVLAPGIVQAQTPAGSGASESAAAAVPDTILLTLEGAVVRARADNPAYRQSVNNLELNAADRREFWLDVLPDPQLNFLSTQMDWNRQTIGTDNFGNPIANPELRLVQSARSNQSASLNLSVDFASFFRRRQLELEAEGREVEVSGAEHALDAQIRRTFLGAQEQAEFVELEERLSAMQATNREITERLFGLARVDRPDLLSAELDQVEQENALEEARSALESALLDLRNAIGNPDLGPIGIEPAPPRVFDPSALDAETLVAAAHESTPEIRRAELDVAIGDEQSSLRRTRWLPTLNLYARTGRQELSRDSGNSFLQLVPEGEWYRAFGVVLSFPDLGTYFRRDVEARRETVQLENARAQLRRTRLDTEAQVRSLLIELQSQYRTLDVQTRRAELARERLELDRERYRLGQIDYVDLQNSVRTVADAERQTLTAQYAFERALIDLEEAVGGPITAPVGN